MIATSPDTAAILATGGDERVTQDGCGLNRYGLGVLPEPNVPAFASSTGSAISSAGFAAADALWSQLINAGALDPAIYEREMDVIRTVLCHDFDLGDTDLIFAESGTTAHAIAAQLAKGASPTPMSIVLMTPAETGRGVPAALEGRYYCERPPLGGASVMGGVWDDAAIPTAAVAIRDEVGAPRSAAAITDDVTALTMKAIDRGHRVLLNTVDGSKTGLIAPDIQTVIDLQRQFGDQLDILIDACQFRITPATLRAYLGQGWAVALTGSKFYSGPVFSSVLAVPSPLAARWREALPSPALAGFSTRGDWPEGWAAKRAMPDKPNFGLLLRWRAALTEMQSFFALPEEKVTAFFRSFGAAALDRLDNDPVFASIGVTPLTRAPFPDHSWDTIQTIFPFLLRYNERWLNREEMRAIYSAAQTVEKPIRVGQPVDCGLRDGVPVSALRLCLSARLAVDAITGHGADVVIAEAMAALDDLAALVSGVAGS